MPSPAKLLIVGGPPARTLARALSRKGHQIDQTPGDSAVDAVVVTGPPAAARKALESLQGRRSLRGVPVLALASVKTSAAFEKLAVDEVAVGLGALERRIAASVGARSQQRRSAALLELVQVLAGSLDAEALVAQALTRLEAELQVTASVVLLEPQALGRRLSLREAATRVDLSATQALRQAVATRQVVTDGQMVVLPLVAGDDVPGALQVLTQRPLDPAQREWLAAVANLLAPSLRNARLHDNLARQQRSLEVAYVERYRELLDANQRLREADKLKDDLLGIASHDVRAPLQVMLGHALLLLESGQLSDEQRHSVEVSLSMSKKILEIVEGLLEKSRGPDERLALVEPRRFDLAELCRLTVIDLQILAQQRGVSLRAEAPESVSATGDVTKLRQVLQNLITNALEHAGRATQVVVRAQRVGRPDGDVVRVTVDDDGPGLPPEQLAGLFDRFRHGSSGKGLAICRELTELHGGEVWAENLPGKGARFTFTVPIVRERRALPLGERPVVLVVDDDRSWAEVLSMALGAHYRVELARDGVEGLEKVAALAPALIVSDVFMPRLDGMQLLAKLRERAVTASVPVVLMTGDPQLLAKVKTLGAADALAKPFDLPSFVHRVDELIQRSLSAPRRVGTDRATGLYDHLGLVHRLEQEVARSSRYGRPLSVLVLKPRTVVQGARVPLLASLVVRALRMPDVAAHLGDGTFAVVLPETPEAGALTLAARLTGVLKTTQGEDFTAHTGNLQTWRGSAASLLEQLLA